MEYIDLSQTLTNGMPTYPGDPSVEIISIGSDTIANQALTCSMHTGTHIDTPGHMIPGGKKITDYPISTCIGQGILIDAHGTSPIDKNLLNNISLLKDSIVLIYTGFGERFYEKDYFSNYPALTEAFALELINAQIKMIGIDTPSPDYAPFKIHKLLFKHDILIIENLKLDQLKKAGPTSFEVIALPLKIATDGSLARVIAQIA